MESFIGWRRQKQGYISRNLSEPLVWFTVTVIQVCSCEELKGWLPVSYLYDTQMWQERTLAIAWRPNPGWAYKKSYWTLLQHGAQQSLDIFSFEDYVSAIRLPWLPPPLRLHSPPTAFLPWLQVPKSLSFFWLLTTFDHAFVCNWAAWDLCPGHSTTKIRQFLHQCEKIHFKSFLWKISVTLKNSFVLKQTDILGIDTYTLLYLK